MADSKPAKKAAAAHEAATMPVDEIRAAENRPARRRKRYTAPTDKPRRTKTIAGTEYELVNGGWIRKHGSDESED